MLDLERVNSLIGKVEASEHETFKSATGRYKVGVDLGTAYIVIVVLDEDDYPVACE